MNKLPGNIDTPRAVGAAIGTQPTTMTFVAKRGRPRKFTRPSRTVSLTLPEDVVATLRDLDADLSRAIVRLAMRAASPARDVGVEVATFGSRAVIVVSPNKTLARLRGVELVPLADGRALIALDAGMSEAEFELEVKDALGDATVPEIDLALLDRLAAVLESARQADTLTLRRIMVLRAVTHPGLTRRAGPRR